MPRNPAPFLRGIFSNLIPEKDFLVRVKSYYSSVPAANRWRKAKWSRCRPGVAQRVGRGIALLFHDRGTRRGWVVSSTPRLHFTPGKDPVPILQEAGWAPGPIWTGGKSRPHRDSIPDRPARSQSLYRLSYPVHKQVGQYLQIVHECFLSYTFPNNILIHPTIGVMRRKSPFFLNVK